MDRYAFELIDNLLHLLPTQRVTVVRRGRLDYEPLRWAREHLSLYAKLIPAEASMFHATSQLLALQAVRLGKRPVVTTVHDLRPFPSSESAYGYREDTLGGMYQRHLFRACIRSDKIITSFEVVKRDIVRLLGIESKRIHVIRYGVDHSVFLPAEDHLLKNPLRICYLGNLSFSKGADLVLRGFAKAKAVERGLELFIGGRGTQLAYLRSLSKELGVAGSVHFVGFVRAVDLPRFYQSSAAFVFPSRVGFALQLLESMACGTPVITSDTSDKREVLKKGAVFLPSVDENEIAHAILEVVNKGSSELNKDAFEQSLEYSWHEMASSTLGVYRELGNLGPD